MKQQFVQLTDSYVADLKLAERGQYIVRDALLSGFFVVVGISAKSFTIQVAVMHKNGKRTSRRRVIGKFGDISTRAARAIAKQLGAQILSEVTLEAQAQPITLSMAWAKYLEFLKTNKRGSRTIAGYSRHIDLYFKDWHGTSLIELARNPEKVVSRHEALTRNNGVYAANGAMRTLSAIYNNSARTNLDLRGLNPVEAVRFNKEQRRKTALSPDDLPKWFKQLDAFDNSIRRSFHLITLITGSRPDVLKRARWSDINFERKTWHFPIPKGGADRAFDLPVGIKLKATLLLLKDQAVRNYPGTSSEFIFPAATSTGHISETKERRAKLMRWGNDLRQSFRTFATMAGVTELYIRILMNHKVRDVSVGYLNLLPIWSQLAEAQDSVVLKVEELRVQKSD